MKIIVANSKKLEQKVINQKNNCISFEYYDIANYFLFQLTNDIIILDNSKKKISRFNSNPIKKKKIAINPSLIQCAKECPNISRCHKLWYESENKEFATTNEKIVQKIKVIPPEVWLWKNFFYSLETIFKYL